MMPAEQYTYISSRLIKEVFALGGRVHGLVPELVEAAPAREERSRRAQRTRGMHDAAGGADVADCRIGDDGGDGDGGQLRRAGVEVIDFGAGEPDFATPDAIKAAAHAGARRELHEVHAGRRHRRAASARSAIATGPTTASTYTESQVIVTAGGKQALYNTALALFGPGDEVITHAPYWPTITEQVKLADATPVLVRTHVRTTASRSTRDAILDAVTPRTRGIIINSPCNPTGALISEGGAARRSPRSPRKQDIWLVVDLCYEKLIYDPVPHNLPKVLAETCPRARR